MRLSPRYDGPPIITIKGGPADMRVPLLRQRRRLEALVASFGSDEWSHATRCEGWTAQDVIAHLVEVNQFWTYSITSGRAGTPTQLLASFDPVSGPAGSVQKARDLSPREVLQRFRETNQTLADALDGLAALDGEDWGILAEAPPGHVSIYALAHHALWDSWIHERDIALPQGLPVPEEADEILGALRYAAALSPAFALMAFHKREGALVVTTTAPAVTLTVTINDAVQVEQSAAQVPECAPLLTGNAVEVIEMLSVRRPLAIEVDDADKWMFEGLAAVFDSKLELA